MNRSSAFGEISEFVKYMFAIDGARNKLPYRCVSYHIRVLTGKKWWDDTTILCIYIYFLKKKLASFERKSTQLIHLYVSTTANLRYGGIGNLFAALTKSFRI